MMRNMRYVKDLERFDGARVAVLGFVGSDGSPRSCAVTPYVVDGELTVTSTLAYLAKVRAMSQRPDVVLYASGSHAVATAAVAMHESPAWFDEHLRDQERRKYPPARSLLALPFHRRLLWWYVGRAVITLRSPVVETVRGADTTTITSLVDGKPCVRPTEVDDPAASVIDVGAGIADGPACLLVHDEDDDMAELRQLTVRGTVADGHLHVQHRSGSLEPTNPGTLAQLRSLRSLGRAAAANRTEIASWNRGETHA